MNLSSFFNFYTFTFIFVIGISLAILFKRIKNKRKQRTDWKPNVLVPRRHRPSKTSDELKNKATYQNTTIHNCRRSDRDDEGVDALEVIVAAEVLSELLSDDTNSEEVSTSGGTFGGAGASGSYIEDPPDVENARTYQDYSGSADSFDSSSDCCSSGGSDD